MNIKRTIGAMLLAAAIAGANAAQAQTQTQSQSSSKDSFSDAEEDEIRNIVRDYLAEHPEVLIEALNIYAERQHEAEAAKAKAGAEANLPALLNPEHGFIAGADTDKAKVAVIEFFDYHCAFCKRALSLVQDMIAHDPEVEVVFREYPILRPESEYAAEMALASRKFGKYRDFHVAMMKTTGVLPPNRVRAIARSAGLNVGALEAQRKDSSIVAAIDENHRIADEMGVEGTPVFIVATLDGRYVHVISGYYPHELATAIAEAKSAADAK